MKVGRIRVQTHAHTRAQNTPRKWRFERQLAQKDCELANLTAPTPPPCAPPAELTNFDMAKRTLAMVLQLFPVLALTGGAQALAREFLPGGFRIRCTTVATCGCRMAASGHWRTRGARYLTGCETQPTLETINLNGVPMATVGERAFAALPQLRTLFLASCGLRALPRGAFAGLHRLTDLDLSGNKLSQLDPGVFAGLKALRSLSLQDNAFATVPAQIFSGLGALQQLYLSNNLIRHISPRVFAGTPALRTLWLQGNRLATVPEDLFAPLMGVLTSLDTSSNPMTQGACPVGTFRRAVPGNIDGSSTLCVQVMKMDCILKGWSAWSNCTLSCGGGTRSREPIITGLPRNGGRSCPAARRESCNTLPCPAMMRRLLTCFWAAAVFGGLLCVRRVGAADGPDGDAATGSAKEELGTGPAEGLELGTALESPEAPMLARWAGAEEDVQLMHSRRDSISPFSPYGSDQMSQDGQSSPQSSPERLRSSQQGSTSPLLGRALGGWNHSAPGTGLAARRSSAAGQRSDSDSDEMPQQRTKDEVAALMIQDQFGRNERRGAREDRRADSPGTPSKSAKNKRGWRLQGNC